MFFIFLVTARYLRYEGTNGISPLILLLCFVFQHQGLPPLNPKGIVYVWLPTGRLEHVPLPGAQQTFKGMTNCPKQGGKLRSLHIYLPSCFCMQETQSTSEKDLLSPSLSPLSKTVCSMTRISLTLTADPATGNQSEHLHIGGGGGLFLGVTVAIRSHFSNNQIAVTSTQE